MDYWSSQTAREEEFDGNKGACTANHSLYPLFAAGCLLFALLVGSLGCTSNRVLLIVEY